LRHRSDDDVVRASSVARSGVGVTNFFEGDGKWHDLQTLLSLDWRSRDAVDLSFAFAFAHSGAFVFGSKRIRFFRFFA
jgi:hypothetical protein